MDQPTICMGKDPVTGIAVTLEEAISRNPTGPRIHHDHLKLAGEPHGTS